MEQNEVKTCKNSIKGCNKIAKGSYDGYCEDCYVDGYFERHYVQGTNVSSLRYTLHKQTRIMRKNLERS